MKQYTITGMSCAACSARVEKAVLKVRGVTYCSVNLLTNSMNVDGTASHADIIRAVKAAGYGAKLNNGGSSRTGENFIENPANREISSLKKRLLFSLVFLFALMYISMGHMMWNFPLPQLLAENHIAMGLIQLLLAGIIMVINQKFFISGFKGVIHRSPNMDTLVALGAGASFIYSTYSLFAMTQAQLANNMDSVMSYMDEFYFESAGMILTLITLGKMLEAYSKGKTTDALKSLMNLAPKKAVILKNGTEIQVPVDEVRVGDIFIVKPGENIPVDGIVIEGSTAVNESALTGESIPTDKAEGDSVSAATTNQSGFIKCRAVKVGEDTTLSQIIKMVKDAAATKAPIAKVADKVSGIFVPVVIIIGIITLAVWLLAGQGVGYAIARSISVLVISCPCALGLATPVAIMVGNGVGAKNGILFKTAASLEQTGKTQIVALDKTGTITKGEPRVTDICPNANVDEKDLLGFACALEKRSEHPLAKAILDKCEERSITCGDVTQFTALPGEGLTGVLNNELLIGGSYKYINSKVNVPEKMKDIGEQLACRGKTPLFFSKDNIFLGIIAVADVIKEDSPEAVKKLQNMGIKVVMLTGDNERTAKAIGKTVGVDQVISGVMPEGKKNVISRLRQTGKTTMVGDGINDAPALTQADIGIAIGAGTDVAIDAADIVLMKSRLSDVPAAIRLSRSALRNIHENLFWAFIYNILGIPLAAGVFIPLLGWKLNPMFAAAAMSLSSFCVVTNALRLNLVKIYSSKKDKSKHKNKKETKTMKKTFKIEGMMCPHCEATVKKALESIPQIEYVRASHESGTAEVALNSEINDKVIIDAIEAQGYKVVG